MAIIYIDNKPYEVKDGQNLLHACLSLGFDIPYFCWHPALHAVGSCRQCAVRIFRDEKDTRGKIVMSCMTPASDGTRLSIDDPGIREFRAGVIEWLMLNHPHDCPVCDEGGECHLQDMTVMTGHVYRRSRFRKRTYRNQYLGPFINHEMNRCIQCYRCVRFYCNYAGGRDFGVFGAHDHVYFGRHEDGVLESEFSGNLIEVCPTGVFTDKTLKKHYTRKWDLQTAPSVCVHCGLGCNTIPGERYGTLRRIMNRYNGEVNGYFLCDRGRFGYEFVNSDLRIRRPLLKTEKQKAAAAVSKKEALNHIEEGLYFGARVIGIGSPRASLEANFGLRTMVGPENFYQGISAREQKLVSVVLGIMRKVPARFSSLRDAASADAVLVLGEDVTNTAPRLSLALRQAVRNRQKETAKGLQIPEWHDAAVRNAAEHELGPLFIASPSATRLDDVAAATYHAAPDDLARLGFAIANEVSREAHGVSGLPEDVLSLAKTIAEALRQAKRPLIVSGTGSGSEAVIAAAADLAMALHEDGKKAELLYVVPECNSLGLSMLGGGSLEHAMQTVLEGKADGVIIIENDLYRRTDGKLLDTFFEKAKQVMVIDSLMSRTASKGDIVLPAGTFAEADGTMVNNEGRAQRFFQVFVPDGEIQESWRWLRDMMAAAGRAEVEKWHGLDDIRKAVAEAFPVLEALKDIAPDAGFRIAGQKIPRQPHRHSGRTAITAHVKVHEQKPPEDPDSPLSFSMEGYAGQPPSSLMARFWYPGWNSVQSVNKFQREIGGALYGGDPGKRIFEPPKDGKIKYHKDIPPAFVPRKDEYLVIPFYHIFGSEEMSMYAPGVAGRAPGKYLGLNPEDGASMGIRAGEEVELILQGSSYRLTIRFIPSLAKGTAGMPSGIPGLEGPALPAMGSLRKLQGAGTG